MLGGGGMWATLHTILTHVQCNSPYPAFSMSYRTPAMYITPKLSIYCTHLGAHLVCSRLRPLQGGCKTFLSL